MCAQTRGGRNIPLNPLTHIDRIKELYRLNIGVFPTHLESVALEYCISYESAAMAYVRLMAEQEFRGLFAYVRRQKRFSELNQDDCELIERLFRLGASRTAVLDALDERRAEWNRSDA